MANNIKNKPENSRSHILNLCYISLGAVLISLCSVITIPSVIPFTLQTFAVFCILNLIGGKCGIISIIIYLVLGCIGLPVFSGFSSGFGILLGNTGGYLFGFILTGIIYYIITKYLKNIKYNRIVALVLGLAACYLCGTLWFVKVYSSSNGSVTYGMAFSWCVLPFIVPDLIKLILAYILSERMKHILHL